MHLPILSGSHCLSESSVCYALCCVGSLFLLCYPGGKGGWREGGLLDDADCSLLFLLLYLLLFHFWESWWWEFGGINKTINEFCLVAFVGGLFDPVFH